MSGIPCRAAAGLLVGAAAMVAAGCSSGSAHRSTSVTAATATPTSVEAPPTTVAGQLPTVYDCGGGAYKPATLVIVCGVGSTMATDVHWTSWGGSSAGGSGSVALAGKPPAPASLQLDDVVASGSGPQFSRLTVTWTGSSPDGRPTDVFSLATAPAR